jgi:hypothetical protein
LAESYFGRKNAMLRFDMSSLSSVPIGMGNVPGGTFGSETPVDVRMYRISGDSKHVAALCSASKLAVETYVFNFGSNSYEAQGPRVSGLSSCLGSALSPELDASKRAPVLYQSGSEVRAGVLDFSAF